MKDRDIIAGSIDHQKIVWVVVALVVGFGIYALVKMKKDIAENIMVEDS